jgi:hypothetical protein
MPFTESLILLGLGIQGVPKRVYGIGETNWEDSTIVKADQRAGTNY